MTNDILLFIEKITGHSKNHLEIQKLAGDASDRKFYRVQFKKTKSWVLLETDPFDPKTDPFMIMQMFFKSLKICVPEMYGADGKLGVCLLEDLGSTHLDQAVQNLGEKKASRFYFLAIDELFKLQSASENKALDFLPEKLDEKKAFQELMFMKEHLLEGHLHIKLKPQEQRLLEEGFQKIASYFKTHPVYCHRDYHSKNIMIRNEDQIGIVDFQDTRLGPITYDLSSLLRDSYVQLSDPLVEELLKYAFPKIQKFQNITWEDFRLHFDWVSIQRNLKAMGSFGYITTIKKKPGYTQYLKPTWKSAQKRLQKVGCMETLLQTLETLFEDRL